jgi:PTS system nitrogen regulatory IIA component
VGLKPEGIDFGSLDDCPSRVFVLTLSPESTPAPHVQFMAALGQALTGETCEKLLHCRTGQEVVHLLGGTGAPPPAPASAPGIEAPATNTNEMVSMADFLRADLMIPRLTGNTSEEIIDELLGMVNEKGLISDLAATRLAVLQREQAMPTGLEMGIAVPHIRTEAVENLVCAIGLKPEGVDFGCLDGDPATIIVLTLSPIYRPVPHVQFMASLTRLLLSVDRKRLADATSGEHVYEAFLSAVAQGTVPA